ncbi:hypothetical protein BH09ACT12_BH09ACT12_16100 [soil metagenome]
MQHPSVQLRHPDLTATVAELHRVGEALDHRRAVAERQVDALLDGGWSGAAARAYLEGWDGWRSGCAEVLTALRTMTDLIVAAGAELDTADDGACTALATLTGRLVERLG